MRASFGRWRPGWWLLVMGLLALGTRPLVAQTSTGTIRGYVKDQNGAGLADANVEARDSATGTTRSATSSASGAYVLPGLVPGVYSVTAKHIGNSPQVQRVLVQIGTSMFADFTLSAGAVEVAAVNVTAEAARVELRTSEVAVNVTPQQMTLMPTPSRNFLDLADLAPGVQVAEDNITANINGGVVNRTIAAGGQSPNQTNVFVDGASLKNDLTAGGIAGQDASRGNPFPRNAIGEYRVITQNFKAEYQNASSAVITATTKSGTNEWHGNLFYSYQGQSLVALDTFTLRQKHQADSLANANSTTSTFKEPSYSRSLVGVSFGGPIQRDRLFFFGSYEGNYQDRAAIVNFTPPTADTALNRVNLTQYNGNFTSPFRETLLFGKLTYAATSHSSAELSFSNRGETDIRGYGGANSYNTGVDFRNGFSTGTLKYSLFSGPLLNEAAIIYDRYRRNPSPQTPGQYAQMFHYPGQDGLIGSFLSTQDFVQRRIGFRDDVTYSGFQGGGQHIFKAGVSVYQVNYDIIKKNGDTPLFEYAQYVDSNYNVRNGVDTTNTTVTDSLLKYSYINPYQLTYGTGVPGINLNNTQVGVYLQDDWSPTSRLTFNIGIRWDFESNMINTGYKTPQEVVDTLTRYNDSLPTPLDLNRYIANGNNRSPFYGAFQPRLGFSYALDEQNQTTVFGGFGIYYDRSIFDFSVDELQKLTHPTYLIRFARPGQAPLPGEVAWNDNYLTTDTAVLDALVKTSGEPEAFLLDNKMKPPMSTQWSLGVRRVLGTWVASVTYQGQRGTNLFTYNWANFGLNPNGSCCANFNIGAHGFRNIIYATEEGKTWYDAVSFQFDRPYRRTTSKYGWGAGIIYTYAKRSIAGVDNMNDITSSFPGAFPNTAGIPKHASNDGNDVRHRIVANLTTDLPWAWGAQFGALLDLRSGGRLDVGCPARFCGPATYINGGFTPPVQNTVIPGGWAYERLDLRLRKDFPAFASGSIGVTADVYNVMNAQNLGCFDTGYGSPNYSKASCVVSDPRRAQLGVEYNF